MFVELENPGRKNAKKAMRKIIRPMVQQLKEAKYEFQVMQCKIEDKGRVPLPGLFYFRSCHIFSLRSNSYANSNHAFLSHIMIIICSLSVKFALSMHTVIPKTRPEAIASLNADDAKKILKKPLLKKLRVPGDTVKKGK